MEGLIKIEGYRIHCVIGAHAHERKNEQELSLDIELRVNVSEPVQTDSIVDTVDYEKVGRVCRDLARERQYHLLETFAYEALHAIFEEFQVEWARIRVKKKLALPLARYVMIELEKSK